MKLSLFGNRPLILIRDPLLPMEAATKNYVDFTLNNHATDASLHITSAQNAFLDAITVTADEVNRLSGVTSGVQQQLDSKLNLTGGTLTGDLILATGHTVFVNRTPSVATELVNKAYVDAAITGQKWENPVTDINLVDDSLTVPPASPVPFDVYIVGQGATGAWVGRDRQATFHNGTAWVFLQNRAVQPGDRFGVALTSNTLVSASLTDHLRHIVTIQAVGPTITYAREIRVAGSTTLVFDEQSRWFGVTFAFTDENVWVPTNTSVNIIPGSGLALDGNILNAQLGRGLFDLADFISVDTHSASGLFFTTDGLNPDVTNNGKLAVRLRDTTLAVDASGLSISTAVINNISDRVSRTTPTTVTTTVTFDATGSLILSYNPTLATHAVNKGYVDAADDIIEAAVVALQTTVTSLNADPVTRTYVDTAVNTRVAKAGDTMTGFLTLHADPTAPLHAVTRQYVDAADTVINTALTTGLNTKVNRAGDTLTGFLTLHAAPTQPLHAATRDYVDTSISALNTSLTTITTDLQTQVTALQATVTTLNADPVTRSYVDAQDNTKVNRAGDTLTGFLTLHANPTGNMHAATKQYVDNVAVGLSTKPSVRVATTDNLVATYNNGTQGVNATLTGSANGAIIVDGVTLLTGDRVLVRAQTNALENGSYVVQQTGNVSSPFILRRVDAVNESHEIPGSYYYVFDGLTLKATGWVATVANPVTFTIGVDAININQFSGQGSLIAGNGLTITGNTIDINTASTARIVINSDNIDLAVTGVAPGNYTRVNVDGFGRVMSGTNPNTLAGYGITDGQPLNANLTSLSGVTTQGLLVRNASNIVETKAITVGGVGLSITNADGANTGNIAIESNATAINTPNAVVARDATGNFAANIITATLTGNASSATILQNARDFAITGDVVAAATSFNGSANVTLNAALTDTGVVAGSYTRVTVDAKGRVTLGSNPNTVSAMGLIDAATIDFVNQRFNDLNAKVDQLMAYVMAKM